MKSRLTSAAWRDLDDIGDWIARSDPDRAIVLTGELLDKAEELGATAFHYPLIDAPGRFQLRKRPYHGYVILFRIIGDVEVMRIVHERRDYLRLIQDL